MDENQCFELTAAERDVDAVGACVGMKGSRVQAIIRELRPLYGYSSRIGARNQTLPF